MSPLHPHGSECLPAATPEASAERIREPVFVEGRTFQIERPAEPSDGDSSFWSRLWPSARMLAKAILREPWQQPAEVLEVGCGLGLAGIAALARGLTVTFSDIDPAALAFAAANARLNGFDQFRTQPLDFRFPPTDRQYAVVIGSDLMYEEWMIEPLVALVEAMLAPGGVGLITDPDRLPSRAFGNKLTEAGFEVVPAFVRAGEPGGVRVKGTLYRIRHRTSRR